MMWHQLFKKYQKTGIQGLIMINLPNRKKVCAWKDGHIDMIHPTGNYLNIAQCKTIEEMDEFLESLIKFNRWS